MGRNKRRFNRRKPHIKRKRKVSILDFFNHGLGAFLKNSFLGAAGMLIGISLVMSGIVSKEHTIKITFGIVGLIVVLSGIYYFKKVIR